MKIQQQWLITFAEQIIRKTSLILSGTHFNERLIFFINILIYNERIAIYYFIMFLDMFC